MTLRRLVLVIAVLGVVAACDPLLFAPEGARMLITASPASVKAGHDSSMISVVIQLETGDLVPYEAEVVVTASAGGLCAGSFGAIRCKGDSVLGIPAIQFKTRESGGSVVFRSGEDTGSVVIKARSGESLDSITIRVVP